MDDAAAAVPPDLGVLTGSEREVLEGFLELCRGAVARKLAAVAELDARRSLVPSRTTLLGLVKTTDHLRAATIAPAESATPCGAVSAAG